MMPQPIPTKGARYGMKRRDDGRASAPNSRVGISAAMARHRHSAKSANALNPITATSVRGATSFSVSDQGSDLASLMVAQTCGKRTAEAVSVVLAADGQR